MVVVVVVFGKSFSFPVFRFFFLRQSVSQSFNQLRFLPAHFQTPLG